MKQGKTTFFLVFLLLCQLAQSQEKYSTVKIYAPEDKVKRAELLGLLQIDHFYVKDKAIIAEVSQSDIAKLNTTQYRFDVVVPDVEKHVDSLNKIYYKNRGNNSRNEQSRVALEYDGGLVNNIIPTPSAFTVWGTLGGYYSFAQMNTAMDNLAAAYPTIAQKFSLGLSVQGRDLWCIKISDNVATDETNEPEILYMGLQHAREAIGGSSMIFLMQYLCENYAGNQRVKDLVDNREIFIIPCMNPDGWEYNRSTNPSGGGGWRKNRKVIATGPTQYGVDLNRNWGIDWGNCAGASASCGSGSAVTTNDTYWGTSAFSEPETQAVRSFVLSHHLVAMIDQHAYGPYYSLPFGRPTLHTGIDTLTIQQQQFYSKIPSLMGTYNGMRAGNSIQSVGYEVAGGVKDWMLKGEIGVGTKGIVYGMTGEGGAGGGTGGTYGNFWPPASEIIYLSKGMVYQNLQLAYSAGSYVEINDLDDIAVASKNGSFNFQVKRIGLGNDPVTVSLIPIENIQSVGSPVVVNTTDLPNYYSTYTSSISYNMHPALIAGQRVKFAWKIQTGGYTYYDTVVKFYSPIQLFYDDMEGTFATNWTSTSNVADKWAYTTLSAYGGTHSMTESPAGYYTTSTTRTVTYNGTFNLSDATAAYLTFWTRHRAENYRDKMQVQVSINGGSTWPYIVAGTTTTQEPVTFDSETINGQPALTGVREDWTKEIYDLSSATFRTNNVKIRFVFTSDANGSGYDFENDDGFYLDNLKMIKSTTALITLPVRFISFTGRLLPDKTIHLDWDAVTNDHHDYFEIEKSANGASFISMGKGPSSAPYWMIDANPYAGNNFYRVKQVDKDGTVTYSNTVKINYDPSLFTMTMYPNPAKEEVTLRFNIDRSKKINIRVTDLSGKTVYSKQLTVSGNSGEIKMSTQSWPSQTYIVKVMDSNNNCLSVQKLIRQ